MKGKSDILLIEFFIACQTTRFMIIWGKKANDLHGKEKYFTSVKLLNLAFTKINS